METFQRGRRFAAGLVIFALMVIGIQIKILNGAGAAHSGPATRSLPAGG